MTTIGMHYDVIPGKEEEGANFSYYFNPNNPNNSNNWTAKAFYDGDTDHAPSESNTIQFNVGD